ncbi:hypothetical protein GGU11DRAFT_747439 [Lentinula aff. detonsa]|nr:hypothetical protein GGU11DRAFT_747439 [Lentinula aff. detonsa]
MSSNTSSHFMRRLVALKSSRQSRKQPLSDIASPASPTGFPFETAHPTLPEPVVTYHTNFLELFASDGETPIAATVPPKLTDLVPPMEETSTPRASEHSRAPHVIEDFDYVGGWVVDDDGKHQYVPRGHIEEIEEQGSNYGPVAGPSHFADAMSLPVSTTPPPRPSLRTKRELPQSPLVPDSRSRFHHSRLTSTPHTPARFPTSLSQSLSSLPPLRGFPPQPTNTGYFSPEEFHQPVSNNGAEALADSLSSLPPLHGFPLQPDYISAEFNTLPQPSDVTAVQIEPLADSLSTLPSLHGLQHFTPRTERISEENLTFEFPDVGSDHATGAFESLGDIESLPPQKEPSPSPVAQEPMEPMPWIQLLTEQPIIIPLYHSTGNDERTINQIISSIKEISKTGVSSLKHSKLCYVSGHSLKNIGAISAYRPAQDMKADCRLYKDLSKRIVEPSKLDLLFKKLRQHHEKLTNIADKFDDTFERLKLRHLYTVASKLTEEANRNRSTYMSAREMYLHKKGRGKRPRASRPQPGATAH